MNFVKIIFLFLLFAQSFSQIADAAAPNWAHLHEDLIQMSWRSHLVAAFRRMDGAGALTEANRNQVLERVARGQDHTGTDIAPAHGTDVINLMDDGYLDNELFWDDTDLRGTVSTGIIPLVAGYQHHSRDRRWTAGWILDTMDIARQQPSTATLFENHSNLENNDLLKVRALSGTFWQWDGNLAHLHQAHESFTGMIQPGQAAQADNAHVDIISCFHGVWGEQLNQLYFLPKGSDKTNPGNYFQVQSVQIGGAGHFLDQAGIDGLSATWNANTWGEVFNQNDYTIIRVSHVAADGANTLRNILETKDLLHENHVKRLRGSQIADDDFHPTRIFSFGKPGLPFLRDYTPDNNGFHLVSDIFNGNAVTGGLAVDPPLIHPLRRISNPAHADELAPAMNDAYVRPDPTPLTTKQAVSIPLTSAMSGGPILKCLINVAPDPSIHCKLIGVVHGANLIGADDGNASFKGLIAIPG